MYLMPAPVLEYITAIFCNNNKLQNDRQRCKHGERGTGGPPTGRGIQNMPHGGTVPVQYSVELKLGKVEVGIAALRPCG